MTVSGAVAESGGGCSAQTSGGAARAIVVASASVADTQAQAARLAPLLRAGDTVLLSGELGAGKTTFTQGVARALGVCDVVTSPTFTLIRHYPTSAGLELLHADVYRLEQLAEVIDLGLPELLEEQAFAVIEWGDRAVQALLPDHLDVSIAFGDDLATRVLTYQPVGTSWEDRAGELRAALAPKVRS